MWFFKPKRIYMDYASATPILPEAARAVSEGWDVFGNPGSIHADGVAASKALAGARAVVARELSCKAKDVVFVSGGTEANNLAILGAARGLEIKGVSLKKTQWVVSSIEHPSVLEAMMEIERLGGKVTHVDPDARGIITPEAVKRVLTKQTVLVSVGWANSEIGTVQPIREIARAVHAYRTDILMHSDAGQAPLYKPAQVHTLDVDLLTLDSGKLYGPRGIGALYVSERAELKAVLHGGGQERGLRAGTENVALAKGFATALALTGAERESEGLRLKALRDSLASRIQAQIPAAVVNGALERALPHMLNISIPNIQSEYITLALDHAGMAISTKTACREGEASESHVVAMIVRDQNGLNTHAWRAAHTLRLSLGRDTTERDIEKVASTLSKIIAKQKP